MRNRRFYTVRISRDDVYVIGVTLRAGIVHYETTADRGEITPLRYREAKAIKLLCGNAARLVQL